MAMVDDDEYEALMAKKAGLPKTKFGDALRSDQHVEIAINKSEPGETWHRRRIYAN